MLVISDGARGRHSLCHCYPSKSSPESRLNFVLSMGAATSGVFKVSIMWVEVELLLWEMGLIATMQHSQSAYLVRAGRSFVGNIEANRLKPHTCGTLSS